MGRILMPLLLVGSISGAWLNSLRPLYWQVLCLAMLWCLVTFGFWRRIKYDRQVLSWVVASGIVLLGLGFGTLSVYRLDAASANSVAQFAGWTIDIEGRVRELRQRNGFFYAVIDSVRLHHEGAVFSPSGSLRLQVQGMVSDVQIGHGDIVRTRSRIDMGQVPMNPGEPDARVVLLRNGIHAVSRVGKEGLSVVSKARRGMGKWAYAARAGISSQVAAGLPTHKANLLISMMFGDVDTLDQDQVAGFRKAGVAHIMAASGLHVWIIAGAILRLFSGLRGPRPIALFLAGATVVLYSISTGLRPSVVRAAAVCIMALMARAFGIRPRADNLLAVAAVGQTLWSPLILGDPGFLMSYLAAWSLISLIPRLPAATSSKAGAPVLWALKGIVCGVIVQAMIWPVLAHMGAVVSAIGPAANLLVLPMVGCAIPLGFASSLTGMVWPGLGTVLHALNSVILGALIRFVQVASSLEWAAINMTPPSAGQTVAYYAAVILVLTCLSSRHAEHRVMMFVRRARNPILACVSVAMIAACLRVPQGEITFLYVGQGDSTYIRTLEGHSMLIDGGDIWPGMGSSAGTRYVEPFLRRKGIRALDLVVLTHGHSDHAGGLVHIVDRLRIGALATNPWEPSGEAARRLLDLASARGIPRVNLTQGDVVQMGSLSAMVANPPHRLHSKDVNDWSVVLLISAPGLTALMTGDAGGPFEQAYIGAHGNRADILKVGHHGSRTSTGERFLSVVKPGLAVISVGMNRHGHPAREVVERLESHGALVLRTDEVGAVTVKWNRKRVSVHTMKSAWNTTPLFRRICHTDCKL